MSDAAVINMLAGLPSPLKTARARELRSRGDRVFAWEELSGQQLNEAIPRLEEALGEGHSCAVCFDGWKRKTRRAVLRAAERCHARRECSLFLSPAVFPKETPFDAARRVSKSGCCSKTGCGEEEKPGLDPRILRFECPWYSDGFDEITVYAASEITDSGCGREELMAMPQDNPHHTLTAGEHEVRAWEYIRDHCSKEEHYRHLQTAALYHDDGKLFTKTFRDGRGEQTQTAHYYGHENVGAYLFLLRAFGLRGPDRWQIPQSPGSPAGPHLQAPTEGFSQWDYLYIANLINWHMRPLTVWSVSPGAERKDRRRMGESMYRDLCLLREADASAR